MVYQILGMCASSAHYFLPLQCPDFFNRSIRDIQKLLFPPEIKCHLHGGGTLNREVATDL